MYSAQDQPQVPGGSSATVSLGRFFDLSADLLWVVGTDGTLRHVNRVLAETLGWAVDELVSQHFLALVHPDDRSRVNVALKEYFGKGDLEKSDVVTAEYRVRCADGSYRWLASRSSLADENGLVYSVARDVTQDKRAQNGATRVAQVTFGALCGSDQTLLGTVGISRDITSSRHRDVAIHAKECRYRSLFDNHSDAVFSVDSDGSVLHVNRGCTVLLGYDSAEMSGRSLESLIASDQREEVHEQFAQTFDGTATIHAISLLNKEGCRVDVDLTRIPILLSDGVVGAYYIARDLTAQREFEAQLIQTQKMKAVSGLAAGIAHDFNNIITVIQGCAEFLKMSLTRDDERYDDVNMIRDAAARATALTRQLLTFSQMQLQQLSIVDLNACITDMHDAIIDLVGETILVTTDLAPDLGTISADVGQIEQIVVTLAENARDAMPSGGELRFATRNCVLDRAYVHKHPGATTGPHIRLSISDNGCGMDEATLSRMFEPFFTTKGTHGTGLGLATVYGIVRQSSGHISVSPAQNVGTIFDVYFPTSGMPSSMSAPAYEASSESAGKIILLVDDDSSVRSLASRTLTGEGYSVIDAANGAEALAVVRTWGGKIDLVITDAMMPVMHGGQLADALAVEYPAIRVLFMSLYVGDEIVRRGADSRRAFMPKPFTADNLTQKVRDVLNTHESAA